MTGVLGGVVVADDARGFAGSLAAWLLAQHGADVVEVTPMDPGDPAAASGAAGKRRPADGEDVARRADVRIVDGTVVERAHEQQVVLRTPPWLGSGTPWAGAAESDPLLAALTGVSLRQASVEDRPVESVFRHLLTVQGVWAAAGAVAALVEREGSGRGQVVTVGGLHGAMVAAAAAFTFDAAAEEPPPGPRPGGSGGAVPFYRTYRCADGEWLFLAALTPRFTQLGFEVLGLTGLLEHERLGGRGRAALLDPEHAGWAIDEIAAVFATRSRDEWLAAFGAAGCPAGPLLHRDDWLDHPQLRAIGRDPLHVEVGAPPSRPRRPTWTQRRSGPLAGMRVIDLGAIIAGPFSASLLAELGADVVKVEPLTGDSFRGPGFAAYNKGQRGIALDLRHRDGRQALLDLAGDADLVVDNYRPGVLGRLGLRYDDLVEVNPTVSTLSVTGFGEGGPLGQEPGFDPVLQAMSGMMGAQGGDGDPVFFTVPVNDVTTAAIGAFAGCLAAFSRRTTGAGLRMWTSLAGTSALLLQGQVVRAGGTDFPGPAEDDRYHRVADGWVRVQGAPADEAWATMTRDEVVAACTAAGVPAAAALRPTELADAVAAEEVLHRDPRPRRETWWTAGRHARFDRTERTGTLVAPSLGEHTRDVLAEAGFEAERIDALLRDGIAR
ncbi:MAG TPA: CoA transferase [Acidimicrobiales bacterium]|nr:CoA transferase [Acidimicrobiales bacterium]